MNSAGTPLFGDMVALTVISMLPIAAVIATSFTKISVVLLIVRNAIGVQQTPPTLLVLSVALILTAFIMYPVMLETGQTVQNNAAAFNSLPQLLSAAPEMTRPLRQFMLRFTDADSLEFFLRAANKLWRGASAVVASKEQIAIIAPAFLVSELTRAFEIGFLLYLPFLMIDVVTSSILLATGLNQMSPTVVSTPFKLLLFVSVDGWRRLVEGLVLSYGGP